MSSTTLHGKVVAITGAARGIGEATAAALTRAGARVAIGDLDLGLAQASAERIGADTIAALLDVTDKTSLVSFLDLTEKQLGPVDIFINNAGIMPLATLLEEDDDMTARMIDVNLRAVIVAAREAARRMVERGRGGHIVNVASTAGKAGLPGGATYCATKSAVIGFSEGIEQELCEHGIDVSVVMPGIVRTELAIGVPDLPGFSSITPEQVADGIVEALRSPRLEVFVPRSAGPLLRTTQILPRAAARWMGRRMKADTVFLQASADPERKTYEDRAARTDTKAEDTTHSS